MTVTDQETIYTTYRPKIFGYLRGKLSEAADAEDLTSEVLYKVLSKIDTFDDTKASLSTWIFTITRNTLYDHFRTRRPWEELDDTVPDGSDLDGDLCSDETLEELADALEALPVRQRELVLLHYYKGITLKETALQLGISYSYAKLLHADAIGKLKKEMKL